MGGLVVIAVVVIIVVVAGSGSSTGYSDTTRDEFMQACTADAGQAGEQPCGCIYDGLEANISYDRFKELNDDLEAQLASVSPGQPLSLPPDLQQIVDTCRRPA